MFKNKTILITGGTGSLGQSFVPLTLEKYNPKKIIIFSRDEMKQWDMAKKYKDDDRVRFFIGDVRDKDRLYRGLRGVDFVVHAAATKIVPIAEYDPFECIKTNIIGAMNVIDACIDCGVEKVVALSTDKASGPSSLYGASKLVSDKVFISANSYTGGHRTKFSVVRYGNVMGSRGSIIPYLLSLKERNIFPITDKKMTRFMITLEQGVSLIWKTFEEMEGGETFVKKIPSINILDIAKAVSENAKIEIIGIRPGEKLHEQMIAAEDSPFTYEYEDYFKIFSSLQEITDNVIKNGTSVKDGFIYNSKENKKWMTSEELSEWIKLNISRIGNI